MVVCDAAGGGGADPTEFECDGRLAAPLLAVGDPRTLVGVVDARFDGVTRDDADPGMILVSVVSRPSGGRSVRERAEEEEDDSFDS